MSFFAASSATVPMSEISCHSCGMVFWVPEAWEKARRADGKNFSCPSAHPLCFQETEAARLKKQLEFKEAQLTRAREAQKRAERQVSAARGQVTRVRNRVANGVCPCCKRHFTNLERHMGTKHPDFKTQEIGQ